MPTDSDTQSSAAQARRLEQVYEQLSARCAFGFSAACVLIAALLLRVWVRVPQAAGPMK